jgi:hypothetical protein
MSPNLMAVLQTLACVAIFGVLAVLLCLSALASLRVHGKRMPARRVPLQHQRKKRHRLTPVLLKEEPPASLRYPW